MKEGKLELRRCAIRLVGNRTCDVFAENLEKYAKDIYRNVTCALCDYDACNGSGFNYVWIPMLFSLAVLCLIMK